LISTKALDPSREGISMGDVRLIRGDSLGVMPTLPDGSVDAIVTDPPAGIRFMGKEWDTFPTRGRPEGHAFGDGRSRPGISKGQEYRASDRGPFVAFMTGVFVECLRIARPGSRCLVWAIPRTSHWTATAIEDAGWIIEDRVSHLFGTGWPKAKSKLKPACEDWWLARKPSKGVPPLNIEACRIAWDAKSLENDTKRRMSPRTDITGNSFGKASGGQVAGGYVGDVESPVGRWPANVVLSHHPDCRWVGSKSVKSQNPAYRSVGKGGERPSGFGMGPRPEGVGIGHAGPDGMETVEAWDCVEGCPIAILDEQSGVLKSGGKAGKSYQYEDDRAGNCYGDGLNGSTSTLIADSGGASRFYATFKAEDDPVRSALCGLLWGSRVDIIDYHLNGDCRCRIASNAGPVSSHPHRHADATALPIAGSPRDEPNGQDANSAGSPCGSCGTSTVRSPARVGIRNASDLRVVFTTATEGELRLLSESLTDAIRSIGSVSSRERQPVGLTLSIGRANLAATQKPTGITTITISRWRSDGSADPVTFEITPNGSDHGGLGSASRFIYCSKASRNDRGEDNNHPTVKSSSLMSWLVRLIARPGETVLDPFMGSGSTGKAAMLEGCHFIGIESHEPYYRIAERRIAAARAEAASRFSFA
jgi:DNA modification methylase